MRYILISLFCLMAFIARAQVINGTITDNYGNPIQDANIYTLDKKIHSHSDALGHFMLEKISAGDTIHLSYLGFKTIQYIIKAEDFKSEKVFKLREKYIELDQVYISNSLKTLNRIVSLDLNLNPVRSSQEILRTVPGLFIGQHAGGGKAEQIFLRGFDIDHGTDINITVDGLPVNMVSHAHGQGYADLHFVIPETIEKIDFGKGPYAADKGNFTTAGYVEFQTKNRLDKSEIGVEIGAFNTQRTFGLINLTNNNDKSSAYIASEFISSDGPFDSPQNFNRVNLMGKYLLNFENNDQLSVLVSRFQSKWDASGQIPQRLVTAGVITRFGSVDDTEGGETSRSNIAINHTKIINDHSFVKSNIFASQYNFQLYSNFTFFLDDKENGDQIMQKESRNIYGGQSTLFHQGQLFQNPVEWKIGLGIRLDDINDNQLAKTKNRNEVLRYDALGQVNETNLFAFTEAKYSWKNWTINPGIRIDRLTFDYIDNTLINYTSLSEDKSIISPKFNIVYNPSLNLQLFVKSGIGFHSNDTRVVVAQRGERILPSAFGVDIGGVWKPSSRLLFNASLWNLEMQQEFVYVGDAGIVEPSGETSRKGIELGIRWQWRDDLYFNADVNYTYARSKEGEEGNRYIPLAPDFLTTGGISYLHNSGFNLSWKYRYIKDRPANETNTIVAEGYFVNDINLNKSIGSITIGLLIENVFNVEWNEAQFATESQLLNEPEPIEELHFTPGVPRNIKGKISYAF